MEEEFLSLKRKDGWYYSDKTNHHCPRCSVKKLEHRGERGLVVVGVLAVGVAHLQGCGRGARGRGAGGFAPGLGEQGGGDGGGGRHGDLDELVALDQPDESFEAVERRLRVSLLTQESLSQVHALLQTRGAEGSDLMLDRSTSETSSSLNVRWLYTNLCILLTVHAFTGVNTETELDLD